MSVRLLGFRYASAFEVRAESVWALLEAPEILALVTLLSGLALDKHIASAIVGDGAAPLLCGEGVCYCA